MAHPGGNADRPILSASKSVASGALETFSSSRGVQASSLGVLDGEVSLGVLDGEAPGEAPREVGGVCGGVIAFGVHGELVGGVTATILARGHTPR